MVLPTTATGTERKSFQFEFEKQPAVVQRRSCKNDIHYIFPVIRIVARYLDDRQAAQDAIAKVDLVNEDGTEILSNNLASKKGTLEAKLGESILLMISKKLENVRLKATVTYKGNDYQIFSNIFQVVNQPEPLKKPEICALKPTCGKYNTKETEVWIRGKRFAKQVRVLVDGKEGFVKDLESDLAIVLFPPAEESSLSIYPKTVMVELFNIGTDGEEKKSSTSLEFTYLA